MILFFEKCNFPCADFLPENAIGLAFLQYDLNSVIFAIFNGFFNLSSSYGWKMIILGLGF